MRARSDAGFTILELLTAFLMAMLMFAMVITLFVKVTEFQRKSEKALLLTRTSGSVFRLMRRDLEGAYLAADKFRVEASPTRLHFWTTTPNRYGTNTSTPAQQSHEILRVEYQVTNGVLFRTVSRNDLLPPVQPAQVLARGVESFGILAFDQTKNTVFGDVDPLPVSVRLTLTFFSEKGYDGDGDGQIDAADRVRYFDDNGNGTDDPSEIAAALVEGRLKRYSEVVVLPAGGP